MISQILDMFYDMDTEEVFIGKIPGDLFYDEFSEEWNEWVNP